jgi:hypothetical protein
MVPNVTSPTSAFSGKRLKLITSDSLSADKLSSSWHVSTTYKKMGGLGAGRDNLYSIVVLDGCSSGGIALAVISL